MLHRIVAHAFAFAAFVACLLVVAVLHGQQRRVIDDDALGRAGQTGNDWLSYGATQAETRYSPLTQINSSNVGALTRAWSYELASFDGQQEATPLVADGVLYGITNWSVVFALDARTGREKWRWDPWVNKTATRPVICCGIANRGLAIYRGMIYAGIIDGRLQALDAETGRVAWESRVAFPQDGYTLTMAPRIAKGKVIIGASGGDYPTRGFFAAYDAITGQQAWRFFTVPGDPSKPFENDAMRKAAETWDGEWWKNGGGGAVWDGLAYDADAGLVYVGTGNAEPWTFHLRSSKDKDNLYVCSILAVDVNTGQLKWHYQVVPGDNWDYDSVQQLTLADLTISGRTRKVIMQASKNGFFYVLDRLTGQFISAEPFARVTWASGIDRKTGRPIVNDHAYYGSELVRFSPGTNGAHNWAPMAFNSTTGLVYIPTATNSSSALAAEPAFVVTPGNRLPTGTRSGNANASPELAPKAIGPEPIDGGRALTAWDPVAQSIRWRVPTGGSSGGGALTTAANLVFHVVNDGRLLVYTADKGEKLFELDTGLQGGMAPPVTYAVDGKQYIALMGGIGPPSATIVPPGAAGPLVAAPGRDGAPATAIPFLQSPVRPSPKLLVFSLPSN